MCSRARSENKVAVGGCSGRHCCCPPLATVPLSAFTRFDISNLSHAKLVLTPSRVVRQNRRLACRARAGRIRLPPGCSCQTFAGSAHPGTTQKTKVSFTLKNCSWGAHLRDVYEGRTLLRKGRGERGKGLDGTPRVTMKLDNLGYSTITLASMVLNGTQSVRKFSTVQCTREILPTHVNKMWACFVSHFRPINLVQTQPNAK